MFLSFALPAPVFFLLLFPLAVYFLYSWGTVLFLVLNLSHMCLVSVFRFVFSPFLAFNLRFRVCLFLAFVRAFSCIS